MCSIVMEILVLCEGFLNRAGSRHQGFLKSFNASKLAKFWLRPITLASSTGLPSQELRKLLSLVEENKTLFEEAWNEFFGN